MYVCACTLYIGETPKSVLFAVCSRFRVLYVVSTIFRFWYVCIRLFLFSFSLAFCFTKIMCETLCKFLYVYARLICIFMQSVMINRKFGGISDFSALLPQTYYLFTFLVSRFSFRFDYSEENENRNEKAVFLPFLPENVRFCRK